MIHLHAEVNMPSTTLEYRAIDRPIVSWVVSTGLPSAEKSAFRSELSFETGGRLRREVKRELVAVTE